MRNEKQLKEAAKHVRYEWDMFEISATCIMRMNQDPAVNNMFLESFAIHTRNLFEFFYSKKRKRKPDDIIAEDFLIKRKDFLLNRTPKNLLGLIEKRANKQIAHLTYHRLKYNKHSKAWPILNIYNRLNRTITAFQKQLPYERKAWFVNQL